MGYDATDDAKLLLAFTRGDEDAFEALYERLYPSVLNVAYRMLGDRDAAEDVAQEVLLKLYTSPRSYKPTARLSTWLYRVTCNACIDEIRKRRKSSFDLDDISISFHELDPQKSAESSELADAVRQAIASLPENQRAAIVLQRYEGLSYQEIAEVLKTSIPAVESLLSRAKESLKSRLSLYVYQNPDG